MQRNLVEIGEKWVKELRSPRLSEEGIESRVQQALEMGATLETANQLQQQYINKDVCMVFSENWLAFTVFMEYIAGSQLWRSGMMGGILGFDWHQIKSHPLIPDLSKEQWEKLLILERVVTSELNATTK